MVLRTQPPRGARIALSFPSVVNTRCGRRCRASTPVTTTRLLSTATTRTRRPLILPLDKERNDETCRQRTRNYATALQGRPRHVAVLGGGLTGLSTAWFLTKFMPDVKVTIYEGSGRFGGWVDSETVEVRAADGSRGRVVFERGARLVQPKTSLQNWDDLAFYELLEDVKPKGDGWKTTETYDRFLYYPDHLVRLPRGPAGIFSAIKMFANLAVDVFREPLYEGLPQFGWNMLTRPGVDAVAGQDDNFEDVSIGDEFLWRGGRREPVDNVVSAMCHGIYGGDAWKLSSESSIFGTMFANTRLQKHYSKRGGEWRNDDVPLLRQDIDMLSRQDFTRQMREWVGESMRVKAFNFGAGFSALTDGIVEKLRQNKNVRFISERATKVRLSAAGRMDVTTPTRVLQYDKVISSLYSKTLASLAPAGSLPSLEASKAVTIRLVNLWSPTPNLNYKTKGFGYLIPQTVPADQNPHAALGVIFDSDRTTHFDELPPTGFPGSHPPPRGDTVPGTKLTVMLGGHHWDDIPSRFLPEACTDDAAAIEAAKQTVQIQMGIPREAWTALSTKLCVDCIPQHLVGHVKRMEAAHHELSSTFKGKLAVVGGSYTAPGVVGSIRAARDVAWQAAGRFETWVDRASGSKVVRRMPAGEEVDWSTGETGLLRFVEGTRRHWQPVERRVLMAFRRPYVPRAKRGVEGRR